MEHSVYYDFLLNMWVTRQITEAKIRIFTPYYISEIERDMILATPQITDAQLLMAQTI